MERCAHASETSATHGSDDTRVVGEEKALSPLQLYYLRLTERLFHEREAYESNPDREEWLYMAINKAAYSAFRSCVEHGVEDEAKALLEQQRA